MQEIRILNEVMPVIKINFEEVKTALEESLTKYENIVVTEETLSGCKATQKELAGLRRKVDTYRKDKKKELSEPIVNFENQCKELVSLIEKVEKPIKAGIKVFDDEKRAEKRRTAEGLIKEVIETVGLNEKYGPRLDVSERYCNLTAKETDVRNDLEARAMALKVEQDREAELLEIIEDSIDMENKRINAKMSIDDFKRLIDSNAPAKVVLAEVKQRAETIYKAENPEPIEEIEEPAEEPIVEEVEEHEEIIEEVEEKVYFAVYRISGTLPELKGVSEYLKANGIAYKVTEQGVI
jgi:hypothetical protein